MSGFSDHEDDATNAKKPGPPRNPHAEVFDKDDKTWPMVLVQWRDAHTGDPGWTYREDYDPDACLPLTVGWVWPGCKEGYLTIVGTVMNHADEPDVVSDINHIPFENVVACYSLNVYMPVNWISELRD